jgi:hypothetical protein
MHAVVTEFARTHRFTVNGEKCGVMLFGVNDLTRDIYRGQPWSIGNEEVEVVDEYTYLGVVFTNRVGDWGRHWEEVVAKATKSSNDLLWMCRQDRGLRPRSAMTLWNAIVRPILEYGSEVCLRVTKESREDIESVQTSFGKGILGLPSGAASDFVRSELGQERIESRWRKLHLGYWRRTMAADVTRVLYRLAIQRLGAVTAAPRTACNRGWMRESADRLGDVNLLWLLDQPRVAPVWTKENWKSMVHKRVDDYEGHQRSDRIQALSSLEVYARIKHWGEVTVGDTCYSGEVGRPGARVFSRYLDDRFMRKGTRLKMLCRADLLPVMKRVGRERKLPWDAADRVCPLCDAVEIESVDHFLLHCRRYENPRALLFEGVRAALSRCKGGCRLENMVLDSARFDALQDYDKLIVLLGARLCNRVAEDRIDIIVKRFLRRAWSCRAEVTGFVNETLDRAD